MKKICVVTSTRAEYGILKSVIRKIEEDGELQLQLVVTGMHLSSEFGLTYKEIENDGLGIDEKVEILLSSDTPIGLSKTIGLGMISFSETFERLKPDMVLILGDRYEMLSVATAAMIARIPIAHLHGGELTEGLIDDSIRHAITKMSYLHFASTEEYRQRIIQLGEEPDRVYNVGALGVENSKKVSALSKEDMETELGITFDKKTILVTFHPVTLENNTAAEQLNELLAALDELEDCNIIFTKANSDTNGRIINHMLDEYALDRENVRVYTSLGQVRYLSALKYSTMVVGNSSSGIIEAPSFAIPTINIGDRQLGRIFADSVIHCKAEKKSIKEALEKAFSEEMQKICETCQNPYEKENTAENIINAIKDVLDKGILIKKKFYDLR